MDNQYKRICGREVLVLSIPIDTTEYMGKKVLATANRVSRFESEKA
jgi:hypothetical protein